MIFKCIRTSMLKIVVLASFTLTLYFAMPIVAKAQSSSSLQALQQLKELQRLSQENADPENTAPAPAQTSESQSETPASQQQRTRTTAAARAAAAANQEALRRRAQQSVPQQAIQQQVPAQQDMPQQNTTQHDAAQDSTAIHQQHASNGQTQQLSATTADEELLMLEDESERAIAEKAFREMLKSRFPLTPEQMVRLKRVYDRIKLAEIVPAKTPPKPIATSQLVSLAPGATPPVIRLAQGFVSSLVFLDSTGSPWPITAYDLGNPNAFNIQWDGSSNTLMIQARELYVYGNLAVRLKGLNTPVMLTMIPGQKAVDYRIDMRIQGIGPNAQYLPLGQGLPGSANPVLLSLLDGIPPSGSKQLEVAGGEVQAWIQQEKLFIRTRLTILSPGWLATMSSADGMHAYEMQKTPILLVSQRGKITQLKVEGL